ncbi:hypothetical protein SeMB42_g03810 [Synchytrium endobioticum]|uniref:Cdc23 domain-containing protein n=1 Tax=Synchytrium endobioticum TaxID=286115 RepID=A0A507D4E5_9FUNG|nr:hypothetical protein SeMB42_g03810 [Synchytrium endobioticum]
MTTGKEVAQRLKTSLRVAAQQASDRGLLVSARWAAEQLAGVSISSEAVIDPRLIVEVASDPPWTSIKDDDDHERHHDTFLLAKSYYANQEYDRAAHVLQRVEHPAGVFLKLYSRFLAAEKRTSEEMPDPFSEKDRRIASASNSEFQAVQVELYERNDSSGLDGYLLYLYGLILSRQKQESQARDVLIESIKKAPLNWSAWLELSTFIQSPTDMNAILGLLPSCWVAKFLVVHLAGSLSLSDEGMPEIADEISTMFPTSDYALGLKASAEQHIGNWTAASHLFNTLLARSPYSLDFMDTYANCLWMLNDGPRLSALAHIAARVDKYSEKTSCIIANYYSMRGEHDKAILHFRRALKLNPDYVDVWTMLGHEQLEAKNPHAAIESFRRAVDMNPRDHRAWFGLGTAYELLKVNSYARHYYMRATHIRPTDARLWKSLGSVYEKLGDETSAIQCYRRAVNGSDEDIFAWHHLARLHSSTGSPELAIKCFQLVITTSTSDPQRYQLLQEEAALHLARHYRDNGNYQAAMKAIAEISSDEGRGLMKEIRRLMALQS